MTKDEKRHALQALRETPGWALVAAWLDEWDQEITDAVKKQIMNLKSEEQGKWLVYYSGQAAVIARLKARIERESRESALDKIVKPVERYFQE